MNIGFVSLRCHEARPGSLPDRKSTRLNSSHTVIYTLSLHDALPIFEGVFAVGLGIAVLSFADEHRLCVVAVPRSAAGQLARSEEHTSELQSHSDLHSFPTRRSSDLRRCICRRAWDSGP